ncbi:uncharacterized protein PFL1_06695 [Pseudozyma flocculosa PF-1]|uniref:Uncharacterized protein n=1 Tax=Pseudozyma flocculosa PF-1 TaxID=1277687 RepID=A0A061H4Y0_9BASI|nr:uncharacterized protein PFL1_06695 [Pseudozyma flocculosa PF-1]EPQ25701.1 hypothetical protein PFL1_06695 [Pseudozyma flocculosa PF-1]
MLTLEPIFVLQDPACKKCQLHGVVCRRSNGFNFAGKSRTEEGKKSKCDYCSFLGKPCSTGPRNLTAKVRALDKLLEVHAFLTDSATLARDNKKVQLEYTCMAASLFEAYDKLSQIAKESGTSKLAPRKKTSAKKS